MEEDKLINKSIQGNSHKYFKVIAVILIIIAIGVVAFMKIDNPELKMLWLVLPLIIVIIISFIIFFWDKIRNLFGKKKIEVDVDKIPEAISLETMKKTIFYMNWAPDFENHFKIEKYIAHNKGNNEIYEFVCSSPYHDDVQTGLAHIFINANYPKKTPSISWNLTPRQSSEKANQMSLSKEIEPDKEVSEIHDPLTGRISYYRKTTPKPKIKYKPLPQQEI